MWSAMYSDVFVELGMHNRSVKLQSVDNAVPKSMPARHTAKRVRGKLKNESHRTVKQGIIIPDGQPTEYSRTKG